MLLFVLLVVVAVQGNTDTSKDVTSTSDSYLNAYAELHNGDTNPIDKRKSNYPKGIDNGYPDQQNYPYPPPQAPGGYGPPQFHQPEYMQPQPNYGSPYPAYGQPHYPPNQYYEPPSLINGIPYALFKGFYDKFKFKLSLITIFKLLLKFVLFKKFVSFVAIICLLLFIPWLKAKKAHHHHHHGGGGELGGDDDDEEGDIMRQFSTKSHQNRINNTSGAILQSIENFEKKIAR